MIKELTVEDLDAFIKIREASLNTNPRSFGANSNQPLNREVTRKRIEAKNDEDFILSYHPDDQSEPVGIVGFRRLPNNKVRHKGMVWGVFVYAEFRGQGIAESLMKELIAKASSLPGLEKIMLSAISTSVASKSLYTKLGFKEYGIEKNAAQYQGEVLDEIFMELVL